MRTQISLRILNSVEGRFVTVMTNTGAKVNGKIKGELPCDALLVTLS